MVLITSVITIVIIIYRYLSATLTYLQSASSQYPYKPPTEAYIIVAIKGIHNCKPLVISMRSKSIRMDMKMIIKTYHMDKSNTIRYSRLISDNLRWWRGQVVSKQRAILSIICNIECQPRPKLPKSNMTNEWGCAIMSANKNKYKKNKWLYNSKCNILK